MRNLLGKSLMLLLVATSASYADSGTCKALALLALARAKDLETKCSPAGNNLQTKDNLAPAPVPPPEVGTPDTTGPVQFYAAPPRTRIFQGRIFQGGIFRTGGTSCSGGS